MKKAKFLFLVLFVSCTIASAQMRAFGGRIGCMSIGASGQYKIGKKNMLQIDLDLLNYNWGLQTTATYNWLFPVKSWRNCELNVFTGLGAGGGFSWYKEYDNPFITPSDSWAQSWFVGAVYNLGFEINFNFGLQLSVEWRPLFAPYFYNGVYSPDFFIEGLWIGACAIGVRYKFNK